MDSINFSKPRLIKMLWSIIETSTKYKNYIDLILTEAKVKNERMLLKIGDPN